MSTKGKGLVRNTEASSGAARPSADTPSPLISAISSELLGEIRAYADANKVSRTAGSSSKRSKDTHATGRSSAVRPTQPATSTYRNLPRRSNSDHAAITRTTRLDELGATHRTWARLRNRKLGVEQQLFEFRNRRRHGLARIHGHSRNPRDRRWGASTFPPAPFD